MNEEENFLSPAYKAWRQTGVVKYPPTPSTTASAGNLSAAPINPPIPPSYTRTPYNSNNPYVNTSGTSPTYHTAVTYPHPSTDAAVYALVDLVKELVQSVGVLHERLDTIEEALFDE